MHDTLQLRWAVIRAECARMPILCGNENMLVDAS